MTFTIDNTVNNCQHDRISHTCQDVYFHNASVGPSPRVRATLFGGLNRDRGFGLTFVFLGPKGRDEYVAASWAMYERSETELDFQYPHVLRILFFGYRKYISVWILF